jgi:hypothetical protein
VNGTPYIFFWLPSGSLPPMCVPKQELGDEMKFKSYGGQCPPYMLSLKADSYGHRHQAA